MPRWASTASPSVNGNHRYLPRRRGSANVRPASWAAKSSGPGRWRRTGRGCSTPTPAIGATGQTVGETTADDLDLGKFGHGGRGSSGTLAGAARQAPTMSDTGTVSVCGLRAAKAIAAAFCSASFLFRPAPGP